MGKIFKGINILVSIFLVFAAGAVAYVAIPYFGNQALIVRSGSMQPAIDIGSIVIVRQQKEPSKTVEIVSPIAANSQHPIALASQGEALQNLYDAGDIIAFRSETNPKTIVTHRVTSIETGEKGVFYKTKGDANEEPDNWSVNPQNILGKVYFTLPQAGKLLAFAKSKLGFSSLIIFPAVLVILMEIFSIIKHIRNGKKNNQSREDNFTLTPSARSGFTLTTLKIIIPLVIIGLAIPIAFALQSDTETSANNIFQASQVFPTVTPSLTPTPTPGG